MLAAVFFILSQFSSCLSQYYVSTYATGSRASYSDGQSQLASFNVPTGVFADAFGNLFVADYNNNIIRKINSTRYVSVVAGSGIARHSDGQDVKASFYLPSDVAGDLFGNIFVADSGNNMIRKINATGYVSTLAGNGSYSFSDGQGLAVTFNNPGGLTINGFGEIIVSDSFNNRIRRINMTSYTTTVAGNGNMSFSDGKDTEASFSNPNGVAIDSLGNIFVADSLNNRIRKINTTGFVSTFAGNGSAAFSDGLGIDAAFRDPNGITIDSVGNLFVSDTSNERIRKIDSLGYVTTIAGTGEYGFHDGIGSSAIFMDPQGITVDGNGTIFVADCRNNKIRKLYFSESTSFSASASLASPFASNNPTPDQTNIFSATLSTATVISPSISLQSTSKTKKLSPILATYLKPEFTYSSLIGMLFVGVIFYFIVKRKQNPKVMGRKEKFLQNLEIQRKLELKQRQQSLPRNPFQRNLKSIIKKTNIH